MPDATCAAVSRTSAMSPAHTATSSNSPSGTAAAATTTAATTSATSEQRPRRCDQQCRYGGYCKKLGYPRHDDLLFAFNSAAHSRQNYGARRWLKVERSSECSSENVIE
ncbi:hypothetical protein [Bradyrhizobium liaoningense]|uniref:hypothetical protein n=1 Tax=Bradyrhizobium liaoningense TaxID=43992 RepID=UPI001BAC9560|nr:hypothetical protein [Bradyrhizobium liaoningense]MBR0719489.1 hypothetical protein [Bradyrhizobium liaoningense]